MQHRHITVQNKTYTKIYFNLNLLKHTDTFLGLPYYYKNTRHEHKTNSTNEEQHRIWFTSNHLVAKETHEYLQNHRSKGAGDVFVRATARLVTNYFRICCVLKCDARIDDEVNYNNTGLKKDRWAPLRWRDYILFTAVSNRF